MWLGFQINVCRTGLNRCSSCEELLMRSASPCISDRLNVVGQRKGDTGLVSWGRNLGGGCQVLVVSCFCSLCIYRKRGKMIFLFNKPFIKLVPDHYQKYFCHPIVVKNKNFKEPSHLFAILTWYYLNYYFTLPSKCQLRVNIGSCFDRPCSYQSFAAMDFFFVTFLTDLKAVEKLFMNLFKKKKRHT